MEQKQKQYPVADVTSARSKIRCFKEQYCIGTWNVRSMNQGKLEVVKQEMARVNVDILGISELKWTGMGSKGNLLQKNLCQHSVASRAVIVSAPDPTAGHCQPMALRETQGHSPASLTQSGLRI